MNDERDYYDNIAEEQADHDAEAQRWRDEETADDCEQMAYYHQPREVRCSYCYRPTVATESALRESGWVLDKYITLCPVDAHRAEAIAAIPCPF